MSLLPEPDMKLEVQQEPSPEPLEVLVTAPAKARPVAQPKFARAAPQARLIGLF